MNAPLRIGPRSRSRHLIFWALCLAMLAPGLPLAHAGPQKAPRNVRKPLPREQKSAQQAPRVRLRRDNRPSGKYRPRPHWARNRGRYATLKGISKGTRYELRHPNTGKPAEGRVVRVGNDKYSKTPYAVVQFKDGLEVRYAAERLHLVGRPPGYQKRYLRDVQKKLATAIQRQLGVNADGVRAVTLRGFNYGPEKKDRKGRSPFEDALGEKLEPGEGVLGFYIEGRHTYVSRHYAAFDYITAVHENLHALSVPFTEDAMNRGFTNAMEGITDFLSFRVAGPEFGVEQDPKNAYADYVDFAKQVKKLVGRDTMQKHYFGKGKAEFQGLAQAVNKRLNAKGAFQEAARRLERDEPVNIEAIAREIRGKRSSRR